MENAERPHKEIKKDEQVNLKLENPNILLAENILITASPMAFTLNCIQSPDRIFSRIGLSPQHAKILVSILAKHVKNYESIYGEIIVTPQIEQALEKQPMGFRP